MKSTPPRTEDFIGTWMADDSAKIVLRRNSECQLFNFNYKKVNSIAVNSSILNGEASWKLVQENGIFQIIITYYDGTTFQYLGKTLRANFDINFYIEGKGLLGQSPPWSLYVSVGDPDDLNKYLFYR